ncbi:MAG: hypothetical protein V8R97_11110 [Fusicatenibacter saccharivorans]
MSLEFVRKLPTPTEIREQYPLSARATEIKKQRDAEIAKVFTGDSDKFLVIVGPCSADNEDAVLEYNHRLAKVADKYIHTKVEIHLRRRNIGVSHHLLDTL